MTDQIRDQSLPTKQENIAAVGELSERQRACVLYAGQGLSSKEIGRALGISPSTVDNHIHVAITKLNAKNRWHAAQLIDPKPSEPASPPAPQAIVPPLGGRANNSSTGQRVRQMVAIAALSLIALTAAYVTILGAIHVFGSN